MTEPLFLLDDNIQNRVCLNQTDKQPSIPKRAPWLVAGLVITALGMGVAGLAGTLIYQAQPQTDLLRAELQAEVARTKAEAEAKVQATQQALQESQTQVTQLKLQKQIAERQVTQANRQVALTNQQLQQLDRKLQVANLQLRVRIAEQAQRQAPTPSAFAQTYRADVASQIAEVQRSGKTVFQQNEPLAASVKSLKPQKSFQESRRLESSDRSLELDLHSQAHGSLQ